MDAVTERKTDKWMNLSTAARALGETRTKILSRIARAELTSEMVAGRPCVRVEAVERLKAEKESAAA
jgi:hypothetical protein